MVSVLIPLALITLCALAVGYLFDRKFEDALPVAVLSVILLLYAFYAFNLLWLGRALVIAACIALPAFAAVRMYTRRDFSAFVQSAVLTPQAAVYAGLIVLFYCLSIGKQVAIWDTLRLWGALPKALHAYGTLQFGADASLYAFSQSYPPVIPLLGYFFTSFSPVFSESALFFARAFFGLSLLLGLTRSLSWSNWHGLVVIAFLMVFVPYYLTTNDPDFAFYYESLYVDAPAGLLCGTLCWQAMNDCYQDKWKTAAFAVTLMAMTLTKDFGALFGGLCVLGSLRWTLRAVRQKQWKPAVVKTAAAAAALALSYASWQILLRVYHVANYNTVTATVPSLPALASSFQAFASSVVTVNLSLASATVPMGSLLLLFALLYALFVYRGKEAFREDLPFILLRLIGYAGYFFAYVMMFRDDIAGGTFPSIARYMVAMLLCETVVFLMAWRKASQREARFPSRPFPSLKPGAKAAACLLAAALLALSVFTVRDFWQYDGGVTEDAAQAAALVEQDTDAAENEIADVWLLIGGDAWENSLLHHRIYFDLIGSGAWVRTYILEANITQSGLAYTQSTFLSLLGEEGYAYVLVVYGDDELAEEFGDLFPQLVPYETDFLLYRVESANGDVSLSLVE